MGAIRRMAGRVRVMQGMIVSRQQLDRKTVGANAETERVLRRGHEPRGNERAQRERRKHDLDERADRGSFSNSCQDATRHL